jgi:hypothetical protein
MNFILNKNVLNTLTPTLIRDNVYFTAVTSNYAIDMYHVQTNSTKTAMVADVSTYPASYQRFELTLSGSGENLSASTANLEYGQFKFTFYPVSGSTLASIDRAQRLGISHAYVSGATHSLSGVTHDSGVDDVIVWNN